MQCSQQGLVIQDKPANESIYSLRACNSGILLSGLVPYSLKRILN